MGTDDRTCPVCGYPDLYEPPWSDGSPSDEICPCCGTQFGYDDASGADDDGLMRQRYQHLRDAWIASGSRWFSKGRRPPRDWNATKQLASLAAMTDRR